MHASDTLDVICLNLHREKGASIIFSSAQRRKQGQVWHLKYYGWPPSFRFASFLFIMVIESSMGGRSLFTCAGLKKLKYFLALSALMTALCAGMLLCALQNFNPGTRSVLYNFKRLCFCHGTKFSMCKSSLKGLFANHKLLNYLKNVLSCIILCDICMYFCF